MTKAFCVGEYGVSTTHILPRQKAFSRDPDQTHEQSWLAWSGSAVAVYITERNAASADATYSDAMLRDGYTTLIIGQSASAPEKLTWANCSTLRHKSGVRAIVALREPVVLRLWDAHGPEMPVREAMGDVAGFLAMTNPSSVRDWSSPSLVFDVGALGARPAEGGKADFVTRVVTNSGDIHIRTAATEHLTSLGGGFSGNAIMLAPSAGMISTCVVLADPDKRDEVAAFTSGLFPAGAGFGQQWALTNAERFESPRHRHEHRASRWYWLGAAALFALTWTFGLWILRNDLAVYAVAGLRPRQIIGLTVAEMLIVALGAALITTGVAVSDLSAHPDAKDYVWTGAREVARAAVAGLGMCTSAAAATATAISRRTHDALKDR